MKPGKAEIGDDAPVAEMLAEVFSDMMENLGAKMPDVIVALLKRHGHDPVFVVSYPSATAKFAGKGVCEVAKSGDLWADSWQQRRNAEVFRNGESEVLLNCWKIVESVEPYEEGS